MVKVVRDIEITFHTTPQIWAAMREGYCGCEECRGKTTVGYGKTEVAALAHLIEQEMECEYNEEQQATVENATLAKVARSLR